MSINFFKKIALLAITLVNLGALTAFADDFNNNQFELTQHDHYRPYPPRPYPPSPNYPPPPSYGCYDHEVHLVCKVLGSHQPVRAYTNCGPSYEGSYCYNVDVPGYSQLKMNVTFQCQYGRWELLRGPNTGCKLVPRF